MTFYKNYTIIIIEKEKGDIIFMKNYRPIYRDVQDWAILDSCVIHDFSENEHSPFAVNIYPGIHIIHFESITFVFKQKFVKLAIP